MSFTHQRESRRKQFFVWLLANIVCWGVILFAFSMCSEADAQQLACADRTELLGNLKKSKGYYVAWSGLTKDNKVILEIIANPEGAWMLLLSRPDGSSCPVNWGDIYTLQDNTSADGGF